MRRPEQEKLAAALCEWFRHAARDLPWRRRRTGWRALVAESMLQQTQVSRVVDRYRLFMRRFPTPAKLAGAGEQAVLAMWQGMGYYRRAQNLHAAARMIVRRFGGRVPRDAATLRQLPGVGRYAAGAVASIVFGRREPIVDGNVARVLARLHARTSTSAAASAPQWAWSRAAELVESAGEPGVLNEALMELGATVCTPKSPRCTACPVAAFCEARRLGVQDQVPAPRRRAARLAVHHHCVVIRREGRVLLERRGNQGLWSNMWQTPTIESTQALEAAQVRRLLAPRIRQSAGVTMTALQLRGSFKHDTTHRRITFHVFEAEARAGSAAVRGRWRRADDVGDVPLSVPQKRILREAAARV